MTHRPLSESDTSVEIKPDAGQSSARTLLVNRLDSRAALPAYQTDLAAGLDLAAFLPDGPIELEAGSRTLVPTGLAIEIQAGFEGQVRPRSGLAVKHGVTVVNAPGTIDADYRGEVRIGLINLGPERFEIEHGMRIAQLVIAPVARVEVVERGALAPTARGGGGFGSTGV